MNIPILPQTIQVADKQTSVIQYKSLPVMTTEQMAGFYGTDPVNIRKNHMRNAERFINGKHFFKVEGDELRTLKNSLSDFEVLSPNTRSLTLWTEKGAARHAKILDTDQAWDIFEQLEEVYFSVKEKSYLPVLPSYAIDDPIERAKKWIEEEKQKQAAIHQLELQAPKIAFVEKYVAGNGNKTFRQVTKLLGANERKFRDFLEKEKIMYKLNGEWLAYQNHLDAKRFQNNTGISESNHTFTRSLFTPKGVEWVAGEWAKFNLRGAA